MFLARNRKGSIVLLVCSEGFAANAAVASPFADMRDMLDNDKRDRLSGQKRAKQRDCLMHGALTATKRGLPFRDSPKLVTTF